MKQRFLNVPSVLFSTILVPRMLFWSVYVEILVVNVVGLGIGSALELCSQAPCFVEAYCRQFFYIEPRPSSMVELRTFRDIGNSRDA